MFLFQGATNNLWRSEFLGENLSWIDKIRFFLGRAFRDSVGAYQTRNEFSEAVVTLDIKGTGSSVVVMSRNNKAENYKSYIDFLVMDKSQAKPVIDVVDDVSSWNVGETFKTFKQSFVIITLL